MSWPKGRPRARSTVLKQRGERNSQARLNRRMVHEIRWCLRVGCSQRQVAAWFYVSKTAIHKVSVRETWGWVQ